MTRPWANMKKKNSYGSHLPTFSGRQNTLKKWDRGQREEEDTEEEEDKEKKEEEDDKEEEDEDDKKEEDEESDEGSEARLVGGVFETEEMHKEKKPEVYDKLRKRAVYWGGHPHYEHPTNLATGRDHREEEEDDMAFVIRKQRERLWGPKSHSDDVQNNVTDDMTLVQHGQRPLLLGDQSDSSDDENNYVTKEPELDEPELDPNSNTNRKYESSVRYKGDDRKKEEVDEDDKKEEEDKDDEDDDQNNATGRDQYDDEDDVQNNVTDNMTLVQHNQSLRFWGGESDSSDDENNYVAKEPELDEPEQDEPELNTNSNGNRNESSVRYKGGKTYRDVDVDEKDNSWHDVQHLDTYKKTAKFIYHFFDWNKEDREEDREESSGGGHTASVVEGLLLENLKLQKHTLPCLSVEMETSCRQEIDILNI